MYEVDKIRYAKIHEYPYPYIEIDGIFPINVYRQVVKMFPHKDKMCDGYKFAKQIDIVTDPGLVKTANDEWLYTKHLHRSAVEFWTEFKNRIFTGEFVEVLKQKFDITEEVYACGRLQSDFQGAGLGPHTDREDKILSAVFYIDNNPLACGTDVLAPKDGEFEVSSRHYSYDEFDLVKNLEYRPNKLIAWKVEPNSFHAFHQKYDTERRTIKMFLQRYEDPEVVRKRIADSQKYADDWRRTLNASSDPS